MNSWKDRERTQRSDCGDVSKIVQWVRKNGTRTPYQAE